MAITLYTGLPGNGKTLLAIHDTKALSEKEGRPVYYHGIKDVTLPWIQLDDPRRWFEVPKEAIVLIDEAQEIFRNRSVGATPPEFVSKLETHRHLGIDLVMITQHPSFIDPHVRRLTQLHKHLVRIRGAEKATVHLWRETRDNPDKKRGDSERSVWNFDKSLYGTYKSADAHTMKRSLSKRAVFLAALFPVFGLLCFATFWVISHYFMGGDKPKVDDKPKPGVVAQAVGGVVPLPAGAPPAFDPVADAQRFVQVSTPRVVGLPQTAPKYDQLTIPTRVPVPAACVQVGTVAHAESIKCKCYTQQGTPMAVEFNMCIEFARNGFFQDFDPDKDRQASQRSAESVQVLNNRADAALPVREVQDGPRVGLLPGLPMGPQRTDKSPPMDMTIQDGPPNNRATRAAAGEKMAAR